MTKRIMIDVNIQELECFLKKNKMTFAQLSHKMFSSISYFTHVKKTKKMMQVKYKTMVEVLGAPYGTFAISDVTKVQNSQEKRQVRSSTMVKINFDELENHLNSIGMTFSRLSMIMNSGHSYFSNVRYQQDCKASNNKYRQMLYVLNLPMGTFIVERSPEKKEPVVFAPHGTFIPDAKPKTFGELLSSGEITPEDFKQQHPSISEQEPEQIELISIEHEMLLEVKKLTSTMQEILNVLKGWE